jgi:hypothetical protein
MAQFLSPPQPKHQVRLRASRVQPLPISPPLGAEMLSAGSVILRKTTTTSITDNYRTAAGRTAAGSGLNA